MFYNSKTVYSIVKVNERIKELLEDKNRLKIDIRLIYGKNELQPDEIDWLKSLDFVRTSFCKNLHAKCYLNEELAIITSLNLYEFSQVNNNEMGILVQRADEPDLYNDAYEEAQRIIRISDEVRITMEKVDKALETDSSPATSKPKPDKLSTSKIAKSSGLKTNELISQLLQAGYLEEKEGKNYLTQKGKDAGGEFRMSKQFGPYFIWPSSFSIK
ncbi:phospholipase D family protein [Spartinivicinus poritis]|uniref:Phospholipase D family protein n=1 Tax=Spartinivicinus poritis TaxID=2994640 RepID=A0ABT5UHN4_9GAMM|nr:phospholipase D family protein [Spartinivicinus sp. A2-2]MDE1465910.1 phospholipase D family protein [Spartinivicinus sp. A2-2]